MDRLEEIKRIAQRDRDFSSMVDATSALEAMDWLIAEVERLRKVEDAARLMDKAFAEFGLDPSAVGETCQMFGDVMARNPRPTSED